MDTATLVDIIARHVRIEHSFDRSRLVRLLKVVNSEILAKPKLSITY